MGNWKIGKVENWKLEDREIGKVGKWKTMEFSHNP